MAMHDIYDRDILKQLTRIANSLEKIEKKLPESPILTENEIREKIGLEPVMLWSEVVFDMQHYPYTRYTHPNFSSDEFIYMKRDGKVYTEEGCLFEDWISDGPGCHNGMRMRCSGNWREGWTRYPEQTVNEEDTANDICN